MTDRQIRQEIKDAYNQLKGYVGETAAIQAAIAVGKDEVKRREEKR